MSVPPIPPIRKWYEDSSSDEEEVLTSRNDIHQRTQTAVGAIPTPDNNTKCEARPLPKLKPSSERPHAVTNSAPTVMVPSLNQLLKETVRRPTTKGIPESFHKYTMAQKLDALLDDLTMIQQNRPKIQEEGWFKDPMAGFPEYYTEEHIVFYRSPEIAQVIKNKNANGKNASLARDEAGLVWWKGAKFYVGACDDTFRNKRSPLDWDRVTVPAKERRDLFSDTNIHGSRRITHMNGPHGGGGEDDWDEDPKVTKTRLEKINNRLAKMTQLEMDKRINRLEINDSLKDLLKGMLCVDPTKRWTIAETQSFVEKNKAQLSEEYQKPSSWRVFTRQKTKPSAPPEESDAALKKEASSAPLEESDAALKQAAKSAPEKWENDSKEVLEAVEAIALTSLDNQFNKKAGKTILPVVAIEITNNQVGENVSWPSPMLAVEAKRLDGTVEISAPPLFPEELDTQLNKEAEKAILPVAVEIANNQVGENVSWTSPILAVEAKLFAEITEEESLDGTVEISAPPLFPEESDTQLNNEAEKTEEPSAPPQPTTHEMTQEEQDVRNVMALAPPVPNGVIHQEDASKVTA